MSRKIDKLVDEYIETSIRIEFLIKNMDLIVKIVSDSQKQEDWEEFLNQVKNVSTFEKVE